VAILSKTKPNNIVFGTGIEHMDFEGRNIRVDFDDVSNYLTERLSAQKDFDGNKLEWKLQLAIQKLPEKQKLVFQLRYYDEMPYEKMSKILDTSEGALKASYHHAAKKIEDYILNH
jgi:RNA polymerase sigma-70 factor (ECF subfamily)